VAHGTSALHRYTIAGAIGRAALYNANCGVVIKANGYNTALATSMAKEVSQLLTSPAAVFRARESILAKRIEDFYNCAIDFITQNN
jgi:hypothetical protein